jgi:hypothetical protein
MDPAGGYHYEIAVAASITKILYGDDKAGVKEDNQLMVIDHSGGLDPVHGSVYLTYMFEDRRYAVKPGCHGPISIIGNNRQESNAPQSGH